LNHAKYYLVRLRGEFFNSLDMTSKGSGGHICPKISPHVHGGTIDTGMRLVYLLLFFTSN
jgi:hypothetical protein